VKQLLRRKDVNPDSSSKSGQTPLFWAAENGHEGIVKLLSGRNEANPNCSSEAEERPLSLATNYEHARVAYLQALQDPT